MAYYSFEKGKYGGPCGTIYPFFRDLNSTSPLDDEYKNNIPAGFLRCRGQILSANQYPNLARVIGVGGQCIYKKANTVLQDPDEDGNGGTIQLPDLGSKYITSGQNSGTYENTTIINPATNLSVQKAGVGVTLESRQSSVEFTYSGDFRVPGRNLSFTGNIAVTGPSNSDASEVGISQCLAHGHHVTHLLSSRINYRNDGLSYATWRRVYICSKTNGRECLANENFGLQHNSLTLLEEGTDAGTNHRHGTMFPTITSLPNPTGSVNTVNISASGLITTVNVNVNNTFKMDDIAPKFILCEFLIKF